MAKYIKLDKSEDIHRNFLKEYDNVPKGGILGSILGKGANYFNSTKDWKYLSYNDKLKVIDSIKNKMISSINQDYNNSIELIDKKNELKGITNTKKYINDNIKDNIVSIYIDNKKQYININSIAKPFREMMEFNYNKIGKSIVEDIHNHYSKVQKNNRISLYKENFIKERELLKRVPNESEYRGALQIRESYNDETIYETYGNAYRIEADRIVVPILEGYENNKEVSFNLLDYTKYGYEMNHVHTKGDPKHILTPKLVIADCYGDYKELLDNYIKDKEKDYENGKDIHALDTNKHKDIQNSEYKYGWSEESNKLVEKRKQELQKTKGKNVLSEETLGNIEKHLNKAKGKSIHPNNKRYYKL